MLSLARFARRRRLLFLIIVGGLAGAVLLGSCGGSNDLPGATGLNDPPLRAASAALAGRFVEKVAAAGETAANTGHFTLTISDGEATSFLGIASVRGQALSDLPIEDLGQIEGMPDLEGADSVALQELLRQGERLMGLGGAALPVRIVEPGVHFLGSGDVVVRGRGRFLLVEVPLRMVVAPHASQGELALDFVEGRVGPWPMPESLFDYLGQSLTRAMLLAREYAEISEIEVTEGMLTISGRWKR